MNIKAVRSLAQRVENYLIFHFTGEATEEILLELCQPEVIEVPVKKEKFDCAYL